MIPSMEIHIDPEADALYLTLKRGRVTRTREVDDGVIIDLDRRGSVLGIEMLDISKRYSRQMLRGISVRRVPRRARAS